MQSVKENVLGMDGYACECLIFFSNSGVHVGTRVLTRCAARSPPAPAGGSVAAALLGGPGPGRAWRHPAQSERLLALSIPPAGKQANSYLS